MINNGDTYVNTLNFPRTEPVFVFSDGASVRHGARGRYCTVSPNVLGTVALYCDTGTDWFTCSENTVITPYYTAKMNADGSFASLYDAQADREWVSGDFNKLRIYGDHPGNYDAWDILPDYEDTQIEIAVAEPLSFVQADGEVAEFAVTLQTEKSVWKRMIRFFRHSRGIEVENIVDWHEKHKLAKAIFDVNVLSRELICDTSAGYIQRETHRNTTWQQARFEVCHHKWCDMAESGGGVALINEGKYGVGAKDSTMSLSLLRATVRPDPTADMGAHDFCYMIYPHTGDFLENEINKKAFEYNVPLAKTDAAALGSLPFALPENLYLQAVKRAEDDNMIVLRLSEQDGRRGSFTPGQKVKLLNLIEDVTGEAETIRYAPFEIITIGIDKETVL